MIWQLLQVGYIKDRPLILLGDMWKGLEDWLRREMVPHHYISGTDLDYASVASSTEDALKIIRNGMEAYANR